MRPRVAWVLGLALMASLLGGAFVGDQMFDLFGNRARACERVLVDTAQGVPGVLSAEADCSLQFGGGWQRQRVRLAAATQEEAYPIVELVLRAFAANGGIQDSWRTPQVFELTTGETVKSLESMGFNGTPQVREVRSHYGIQPVR
ncbi:MAG: hypothetical protein IPL43_12210 [Micropruina sp.]|nr:hypothetical protein [Micropruina sp.]